MKKDISIITPLYNGEKYIAHCIDSVLAQNAGTLEYEIIIVDDGSQDNSAKIIDQYASQHPDKVIAIHQQNKGASEARKIALKYASGEFLVFLDADDWLESHALKAMHDRCKKNNLDFLECTFVKYDTPQKSYHTLHKYNGIFSGEEFYNILFDINEHIVITSAMSRRSLWNENIFLPEGVRLPNEDLFPLYSIAKNISRVEITNDLPIYHYRYNPDSATHTNVLISQQSLWREYFVQLRNLLTRLNIAERYEIEVRIMEVDRMAFNVLKIDTTDEWYNEIISYDTSRFGKKHRILAVLLKWPKLCRLIVGINRRIKASLVRC